MLPALSAEASRRLNAMNEEDLAGQLLCVYHLAPRAEQAIEALEAGGVHPGGVLVMNRAAAELRSDVRAYQAWNPTPMLVAANLETGTRGAATDGEVFANPMQCGATGEPVHAARLGDHCARHGRELGVTWAFAPVVDLALNHQNPIVNTRAFGSDPETVGAMGAAYVEALQARGVAASVKHFPGDGVDGRDQHLVTSVNSLPMDQWDETYGRVYRAVVEAGAWTVMAGHIALPDWSHAAGLIGRDAWLPAPLNGAVLGDLLRGRLGFDGMVVTDNTLMAGFTRVMDRAEAVVRAVNAGCDMILGSLETVHDHRALLAAVRSGAISGERLMEAVERIWRVKQAVGILDGSVPPGEGFAGASGSDAVWARQVAEASITLAKRTDAVLPVTAERYPRVLVYVIDEEPSFYDGTVGFGARFVEALRARGMDVVRRDVPAEGRTLVTERDVQDSVDLVVYFSCLRFDSVSNVSRIRWSHPQAPETLRHPTRPALGVSVADPYLLQDLPSLGTLVNGYCPTDQTVDAIIDRITGDAPFTGVSPVDQFCGHADASL
jgi:beta-N-acetylhexosaminidase